MKTLKLDMVQYDCPYIQTTRQHDVAFHTQHWEFDQSDRTLETRLLAIGSSRSELSDALETFSTFQMSKGIELLSRKANTAMLRSQIDETNAMRTVLDNDGYVTGPFVIRDGSEIWNVGFDTRESADRTLAELERENEYDVASEGALEVDDFFTILQNLDSLGPLLSALQQLTDTELETLETAVENGYFSTPRGMNLEELSNEFDVSKMGASKNLRRSQRKVLREVVRVANDLDTQADLQDDSSFQLEN